MKSFAFPIHFGELNGTPVGDLRLAVSDQGMIAVEWANTQLDFDSYLLPFEPDIVAPYAEELREYLSLTRLSTYELFSCHEILQSLMVRVDLYL